MSRALKKDSWQSVFWIVCALLICVGSYRLSLGSLSDPGPGMFPFLAGAALCMLSIIEWWNISRASRKDTRASAQAVEPLFANRLGAVKAAAIILALLIYALTMEHLGFILSTTLFIAFLLWMVERQRWYVIVFGAVVSSLTTYLVFKVWLDTALPVGLLGF